VSDATAGTNRLPLYAIYSPAFEVLVRDFFLPSLPNDVELRLRREEITGAGNFQDPAFNLALKRKLDRLRESLVENHEKLVVWTDVDVQFFAPIAPLVRRKMATLDVCFQAEWRGSPEMNVGFMGLRCNSAVVRLFDRVAQVMEETGEVSDQKVVNHLLPASGLRIGQFPLSFYASSHGRRLPRTIALHHANDTVPRNGRSSLELKLEQLRHVRERVQRERWWRRPHGFFAGIGLRLGLGLT
jgi:hypothetical protein